VIGNCPELGGWDVQKAPVLQYINTNTWMGDISINESAGKRVFYKYMVVSHDNSILYECRIARQRILPSKGHVVWKNEWI
jgi:cyclomaltodextrin glucanotransferase